MSEVREQSNKEGRLWFLGVDAQEYTGELPDVQADFRKSRGTRDQIANIC